jgi:fumarate hydratase class II
VPQQEAINRRWDGEFWLVVFQTGSGTQTSMNAGEVIANLRGPACYLSLMSEQKDASSQRCYLSPRK